VKGVKLTRNFGQHSAITAGLKESRGQYVVVMDCDLQDNPVYIAPMLEKAREGYEIIFTRRSKREYSALKNVFARFYFFVFNWLTETQIASASVGAFSLVTRNVVDAFCRVQDAQRHYLMVLRWLGFSYAFVEVQHDKRFRGKSSYNLRRLLSHAINGITSQSNKLLYLSVSVGLLYFCVSLISIVYLVTMYFLHGYKEGWASTIVLLLLSTGLILMAIGVAGIYIGKIFEQVKGRPLYLIDRKINF
jgi:polyisoprenyl-phosphate glycosyltransferase